MWNIAKLDSILSDVLKYPIPGVNMPYLYFGMWKATFPWSVIVCDGNIKKGFLYTITNTNNIEKVPVL